MKLIRRVIHKTVPLKMRARIWEKYYQVLLPFLQANLPIPKVKERINKKLYQYELYNETRKRGGALYKDKTFFVIRHFSEIEGHCSILNTFLGHFLEAQENGYIPVIDMKNHYSALWQSSSRRGKENAWEYFYEQPSGYGIEQIKYAKNQIFCRGSNSLYNPWKRTGLITHEQIEIFNKIYNKYVRYNTETELYVKQCIEKLKINERRILGISIRRGIEWGYIVNHPWYVTYMETITLDEHIKLIKTLMKEYDCEYVFVTIDDQEGIKILKSVFDEKLLYIQRSRPRYFEDGIPIPKEVKEEMSNRQILPEQYNGPVNPDQ